MKKSSLILAIIFLFSMGFSQRVEAQDKKKEEKEKQMQEAIEAQKKAMVEQKKAQEEAEKEAQEALKESDVELQKVFEEARVKIEDPVVRDRIMRVYEDMGKTRNWSTGEPFVFTPGVQFYGQHFGEDTERTTWEFSKYVKETSFTRDYTFDVEPTVNTVVMSVNGDCKAGEIRIKIVMPGGKIYSDIVIDEFGNLNWRKSFTISDTENKDKAGAWKFEISSSKASGYFKISLQTY
ncbi:MAG: hypothetical protein MUF36_10125 [Bacteroidales bacterium]|jgi:hypothetical protein|nr:hypothetical protein [Bacteroidales bacterium]